MSKYTKLSAAEGIKKNNGLREALILLGKNQYHNKKRLQNENKKSLVENSYYKIGRKLIAKKFGRFNLNAINYMVYPNKKKRSLESFYYWFYHEMQEAQIIINLKKIDGQYQVESQSLINKLIDDYNCSNCVVYSDILLHEPKKTLDLHVNTYSEREHNPVMQILAQIAVVDQKHDVEGNSYETIYTN